MVNYSRKAQHPQFGKINDPKLDKGDFVFDLELDKRHDEEKEMEEELKHLEAAREKAEYQAEKLAAKFKKVELKNKIAEARRKKKQSEKKLQKLAAARINDDMGVEVYTPESESGKTWRDPVIGMEFVRVPKGCFEMGSSSDEIGSYADEGPVHTACVDEFWMGKYEVTNAQYRKYKPKYDIQDYQGNSLNNDNQPAIYVSWNDAKNFAKWLTPWIPGKL